MIYVIFSNFFINLTRNEETDEKLTNNHSVRANMKQNGSGMLSTEWLVELKAKKLGIDSLRAG